MFWKETGIVDFLRITPWKLYNHFWICCISSHFAELVPLESKHLSTLILIKLVYRPSEIFPLEMLLWPAVVGPTGIGSLPSGPLNRMLVFLYSASNSKADFPSFGQKRLWLTAARPIDNCNCLSAVLIDFFAHCVMSYFILSCVSSVRCPWHVCSTSFENFNIYVRTEWPNEGSISIWQRSWYSN